jgi:hypothetical protein
MDIGLTDDTLTIQGFYEILSEPFPGGRKANDIRDSLEDDDGKNHV